jgi:hypothetical protein
MNSPGCGLNLSTPLGLQSGITSLILGKVAHLSMVGTQALADMPRLRSLELVESSVPDSALQPLSRLTALQQLSLRDCCKLSDGGLKVGSLASFGSRAGADVALGVYSGTAWTVGR